MVVGAGDDDDGGSNRGAVWVLFLNADGTVSSHQKISDTEGGFTGTLDNSDNFGSSVAGLGDFDGDGIEDIAVGAYYLGVHRAEDGDTWSLAFMDPTKIRRARLDASEIAKATIDFMVPMTFAKAEETAEKLAISLASQKDAVENVTLKVVWGNFQLTTPIQVIGLE